jgi:hypothetical protein
MSALDDEFDFFRSVITEVVIAPVVLPVASAIIRAADAERFRNGTLMELALDRTAGPSAEFFCDTAVASKMRLTRTDSRP